MLQLLESDTYNPFTNISIATGDSPLVDGLGPVQVAVILEYVPEDRRRVRSPAGIPAGDSPLQGGFGPVQVTLPLEQHPEDARRRVGRAGVPAGDDLLVGGLGPHCKRSQWLPANNRRERLPSWPATVSHFQ
jgi:hypothetical protein